MVTIGSPPPSGAKKLRYTKATPPPNPNFRKSAEVVAVLSCNTTLIRFFFEGVEANFDTKNIVRRLFKRKSGSRGPRRGLGGPGDLSLGLEALGLGPGAIDAPQGPPQSVGSLSPRQKSRSPRYGPGAPSMGPGAFILGHEALSMGRRPSAWVTGPSARVPGTLDMCPGIIDVSLRHSVCPLYGS